MSPEDRAGSAGQDLEDSARQLELLAALQTGNAEVVQRARPPETPSSPKPVRSAAIGLMLGLLLAVAATLIREQVDRRLRDPGDVADILNVPVLALIPEDRTSTRSVATADTPLRLNTEAFMMLRANLRYFNVDEELTSILVMSAGPEEGKTSISWNLARAEARAESGFSASRPTCAGRPSPGMSAAPPREDCRWYSPESWIRGMPSPRSAASM